MKQTTETQTGTRSGWVLSAARTDHGTVTELNAGLCADKLLLQQECDRAVVSKFYGHVRPKLTGRNTHATIRYSRNEVIINTLSSG